MFLGLTSKELLGLTVVGSLVTVLGNLIAVYLKDIFAVRSIERWKMRQALDALYDRYRRPICMAAAELSGRCYTLATAPEDWRRSIGLEDVLSSFPNNALKAEAGTAYFRYKIASDAYRLCCFLGWLELYRRDLGLMNVASSKDGRILESCIKKIRSDLGDGQITTKYQTQWHDWRDFLIFREEQRAIAHRMITPSPSPGVIDYGTFCEMLQDKSDRWFISSVQLFVEISSNQDFRRTRMKLLVVHLTALREHLQPGSVWPPHLEGSKKFESELTAQRRRITMGNAPNHP